MNTPQVWRIQFRQPGSDEWQEDERFVAADNPESLIASIYGLMGEAGLQAHRSAGARVGTIKKLGVVVSYWRVVADGDSTPPELEAGDRDLVLTFRVRRIDGHNPVLLGTWAGVDGAPQEFRALNAHQLLQWIFKTGLAAIRAWLRERGEPIDPTTLPEDPPMPPVEGGWDQVGGNDDG